jgi:hypothetical protein
MCTSPDTAESHVRVGGNTVGFDNAADVLVAPTVLPPVQAAIARSTAATARRIP